MRKVLCSTLLLLLALSAAAAKELSLDELKARVESATGGDRAKLAVEVMDESIRRADSLFESGDYQNARAALADAAVYGEKGGEAAISSGKRLKNTEISIRKAARKLQELARQVEFSERQPVTDALERLQKTRSNILDNMFKK